MVKLNAMLSTLRLVYPPVSNFEAESLKEDPAVEALLRTSDFYIVGARAEVLIEVVGVRDDHSVLLGLTGQSQSGDELFDTVALDIDRLATDTIGGLPDTYLLESGPKFIRFWPGSEEEIEAGDVDPFEWFTTDKLIHDRGREVPGISGFDSYREFATYELLYVGIAKETDTFERLFQGAHHARQKMLSREWPRRTGARVTDELILFAFRVEPTIFRSLMPGDGRIPRPTLGRRTERRLSSMRRRPSCTCWIRGTTSPSSPGTRRVSTGCTAMGTPATGS